MSKTQLNLALVAALLVGGATLSFAQDASEQEAKLIAVLKSDAAQKAKADACRELGRVGTRNAVPALAALLSDPKLSHMARYGLEPIPDPSVDAALRDALGRVNGRLLAGVIGSIGVRRDAQAVASLAALLKDADADVAQAAARALGSIGTPEAIKSIQGALPGTPVANQLAFCEGLFRAAEGLAAKGQRAAAVAIYEPLIKAQAPHQVRAAAVRGAILARQQDGLPVLRQYLRSGDYVLFAAAVRAAQEMKVPGVTEALTAELGQLPADNQVVVMQTLSMRGDPAALPALFRLAKGGEKPVRIAAIRSIPGAANASAVQPLAALMGDADREVAKAAQESFAALPGKEVDAAVMAMLGHAEPDQRLAALDLIGRRRMLSALPTLMKTTSDGDAKVRTAALKRIGELGGSPELAALLNLLMQMNRPQDIDGAEQALSTLSVKEADREAAAETIASRMAQAQPAQKGALLGVLSAIGGDNALKAVRGALNDANPEVRAAAIRALGDWKTADAAPDLLSLAQNASTPADKMRSLRSYLALAGHAELPADQRLSMCRQAASLAQKPEEKKLLLSALGGIPSMESLGQIAPYLEDAATKDEACAATLNVAEKLLQGRPGTKNAPRLIDPLQKVAQVTANADLSKRAKDLLQQAQTKAGRQ